MWSSPPLSSLKKVIGVKVHWILSPHRSAPKYCIVLPAEHTAGRRKAGALPTTPHMPSSPRGHWRGRSDRRAWCTTENQWDRSDPESLPLLLHLLPTRSPISHPSPVYPLPPLPLSITFPFVLPPPAGCLSLFPPPFCKKKKKDSLTGFSALALQQPEELNIRKKKEKKKKEKAGRCCNADLHSAECCVMSLHAEKSLGAVAITIIFTFLHGGGASNAT